MNFAFRHEAREKSALGSPRLARVEVMRSFDNAEQPWRDIQRHGAVQSPYQSFEWVTFWHRHADPLNVASPLVVVGYDESDAPLFLLPLACHRLGALSYASFVGGKHATLNLPAWRRDFAGRVSRFELNLILDQIARRVPELDLVVLLNQPASWNGIDNPIAKLPHQRSAEDAYRRTLVGGADPAANITSSMRRRLRKKENQLAKIPGYRYTRATTRADVERLLAGFFEQKAAHLASLGSDNAFGKPEIQAFVRAACHQGLANGEPVIELHALEADGEILAIFAGLHDRRRFTLAFNSLTSGPNARYSPGLVLLQHLIVDCARRGFESFDIGPGDARYKTEFCKELDPIIDSVLPLSSKGRIAAPFIRGALAAKSLFKRSPVVWRLYVGVKRRLRGKNVRAGTESAED